MKPKDQIPDKAKLKKQHKKHMDPEPMQNCPACGARGQCEKSKDFFIVACHKEDADMCLKKKYGKLCMTPWLHTEDGAIRKWNKKQAGFAGLVAERKRV